jgi:hypothetical protein
MRKSKRLKEEKELKRRYGKLAESMEPYYHHLDLRMFDDLTDEAFAYIMTNVKGVNMLDLNETQISNESIKLLTRLEYVNELRAKGCGELDNGCIKYLDQLTSLSFLHVKSTAVTIDGLLQLSHLTKLKELMFSAEETGNMQDKMLQLKKQLPGCSFTVNSTPWIFEETNQHEDVN